MATERPQRRSRTSSGSQADAADLRSAEIRSIALMLVARDGYDSVTIDEIAAVARASKATVYRRWPSKAALVVDAVRHNVRQLQDPGETGTLRGDLLTLLSVIACELNRDGDLVLTLIEASRRDPELMDIVSAQLRQPGQAIGRLPMERAIERGDLPPDVDLQVVAEVAMPMLLHRSMWHEPLDDAFIEYLVDEVLLHLLTAKTDGGEAEGKKPSRTNTPRIAGARPTPPAARRESRPTKSGRAAGTGHWQRD